MIKNVVMSALAIVVAAGVCLCVAAGGCAKSAPNQAEPAPALDSVAQPERGVVRLGNDATLVGQLEQPATVRATVYSAAGTVESDRQVELEPGTWLVPESVYDQPGVRDGSESGPSGIGRTGIHRKTAESRAGDYYGE
ncbi:MAG: hypothetical protein LIP23_09235 [Planctomycetes bacterium]|nr:hypothetical protein [Planctomycetota bacterium]